MQIINNRILGRNPRDHYTIMFDDGMYVIIDYELTIEKFVITMIENGIIQPVSVVSELADYIGVGKTSKAVVEAARKLLMANIMAYDVSDDVNMFYVGGQPMWLDKATRVSLMSTLQIEKGAGLTETTFWWDATPYTFPVAQFEQMLSALELYAKGCYDRTQSHLAAAKEMTKLSDMCEYDYTTGYPDKLSF